jgi:hypothetical protein
MEYTFSIVSKVQSESGEIAQVHMTMEDAGSVPNVILASMVVVSEINYQNIDYPTTTVLEALRPIENDGFLFPNETYSFDFPIVITEPMASAVQFTLSVYFARTTWLALGSQRATSDRPCGPESGRSEWYIRQSHLRQFAQGNQVLYSDWCPGSKDQYPSVYAGISGIRNGRLVPTQSPSPIGSDLGILRSSRTYVLLLS